MAIISSILSKCTGLVVKWRPVNVSVCVRIAKVTDRAWPICEIIQTRWDFIRNLLSCAQKKSKQTLVWLCHVKIYRDLHAMPMFSVLKQASIAVEYNLNTLIKKEIHNQSMCHCVYPCICTFISFCPVCSSICLSFPYLPSTPTVYLSWAWPCWLRGYDLTLQTLSLSSPHCCISLRHWRRTHTFTHYTPQRHAVQFTLKRSMLLGLIYIYMAHQSWMDNHACELRDIEMLIGALGNFSVYLMRLQSFCLLSVYNDFTSQS